MTEHADGTIKRQPVALDESVLNIRRDLMSHLNEEPLTDAWLQQLRDYCTQRLAARAEARTSGGIAIPNAAGAFEVQPLEFDAKG